MGKEKDPPVIEGQFRVVGEDRREPIFNQPWNLIPLFGPMAGIVLFRLGQIKGWW